MPTEADKPSSARRAFLTGDFFTSRGRAQLTAECARQGQSPQAVVSLDTAKCLAWQRMTCRGCVDACADNAISLISNLEPRIDQERCSSCGKCAIVCPVEAIRIAMLGKH